MIGLKFEDGSVDSTEAYIRETQEKVLAGLRGGMDLSMQGLANAAAARAPFKSGKLASNILHSARVTETSTVIRGTVSASEGAKHLGVWLEIGISEPAVDGKLMVFTPPSGDNVFTMAHKAFQIPGHPFMNPALEEYEGEIFDILGSSVEEATSR